MENSATMLPEPMQLAVADISNTRVPGQFKMTIESDRKWIRHEVVAWSVGLKWLTFVYHDLVHDQESPLFLRGRDAEYLKTVEQPTVEGWIREHLPHHEERHAAALLHGLAPGGENDLPAERILIDRVLKEMVEREGIDVYGTAEKAGGNDDYYQLLANEHEHIGTNAGGRHFRLEQLGPNLPVLSTWMPIGHASYCGHMLNLDYRLPETICAGVTGRRLGEVVATGIPDLDARVITKVVTSPAWLEDHSPSIIETRVLLQPDLVEIGI